jgi:hypothetical protein
MTDTPSRARSISAARNDGSGRKYGVESRISRDAHSTSA